MESEREEPWWKILIFFRFIVSFRPFDFGWASLLIFYCGIIERQRVFLVSRLNEPNLP